MNECDGRPGWDEWAFGIVSAIARRGDCSRRQVGALILGPTHRIIGAGYNGTYDGGPSCLKGDCPRATSGVLPGSSYDTGPGACIASHAEANAVSDAQQRCGGRLAGCTMYVSCEPCEGCVRHVRNQTDIKAIIWPGGALALP